MSRKTGSDVAEGSEASPFLTINRAAAIAQAGDTVVVHAGEYREWVQPQRGGAAGRRLLADEGLLGSDGL